MTKRTPLYEQHLVSLASMVDFHGWELPIHYGSQIKEHQAVRDSAGMFDVSHMNIVDLKGSGTTDFLRHLLANDVAKLKAAGKALYTPMLNHAGGIIDDLIVYKREDGYRLVLNSATYDKDMAWLKEQASAYEVEIERREELCIIAVQGYDAREKVKVALSSDIDAERLMGLKPFEFAEFGDIFIARTGYTGEDGFEMMLPVDAANRYWERLVADGVTPCGLGARDTLRLEAGLNLYGSDMSESETPLTSNIAWTVTWNGENREFIGQKALEKQRKGQGYPLLLGLILQTKGVLRSGMPVFVNGEKVGETVSGTFSPCLQKGIAFARIHAELGDRAEIEMRGKRFPVEVVKLPFIKGRR